MMNAAIIKSVAEKSRQYSLDFQVFWDLSQKNSSIFSLGKLLRHKVSGARLILPEIRLILKIVT